jgi:hypothetical protein
MKTQTGRALLFGADGTITWAAVTANTTRELQGVSLTDNFDVKDAKDRNGNIISLAAVNPTQDVTFDFLPLAGTGADTLANAKLAIEVPAALASITIADLAAIYNGTWMYVGGGKADVTNEGFVKMSLPCRRVAGAVLAATT